ncbi:hypothetical protein DFQ28_007099 [Apophysomyces sp. BC1034]|nr:hypothetical protein DFQ30_008825 [Apophysomyces sp. BC1015]KAG0175998.1 hypothetical protein DFQ29_006704 [Apophysomyces sp. BC1021]KAG0192913.1 hypothetical protein DFQ28_007099 [Apophysomyces sp. BC1034]
MSTKEAMPPPNQDLESLVYLETMFQEYGFEDGYRDGTNSGELEGRVFGCEKAFELGREIGFYAGCAEAWTQLAKTHDAISPRALRHIAALQKQIDEFPHDNCPKSDLFALRDKMKNKLRVVTSLLGVQQKFQMEEKSQMNY